eukprot:COSAG04_NODE_1192_length_7801_cov_7.001298_3_plen_183_part_00
MVAALLQLYFLMGIAALSGTALLIITLNINLRLTKKLAALRTHRHAPSTCHDRSRKGPFVCIECVILLGICVFRSLACGCLSPAWLLRLFVMCIVLCQVLVVHVDSLSRRLRRVAAGREQLKDTDMRVKLTNEALLGIRVLKYNVWEEPTIQRAPPTLLPCDKPAAALSRKQVACFSDWGPL